MRLVIASGEALGGWEHGEEEKEEEGGEGELGGGRGERSGGKGYCSVHPGTLLHSLMETKKQRQSLAASSKTPLKVHLLLLWPKVDYGSAGAVEVKRVGGRSYSFSSSSSLTGPAGVFASRWEVLGP